VKTIRFVVTMGLALALAVSVYAAQQEPNEKEAGTAATDTAKKDAAVPQTELEQVSYIFGARIGASFVQQGVDIKVDWLAKGMTDAIAARPLALTNDQMAQIMQDFQNRIAAEQQQRLQRDAAKNLAEGTAFLAANKKKEGVKVLPSGLQYKILKQGTGSSPTAQDKVRTHYRGRFINGAEFDSSYKRGKPAEFALTGVIKGWTEALQLMKEGAKWELYVPANLAYGEKSRQGMPPNSTLIFEVELLEVLN